MNKYLEKIAGLPISASNLKQVAATFSRQGLDFTKKMQVGKSTARDLMKLTSSSSRLNKNIPKHLLGDFEKAQIEALTKGL